MKKVITWLKQVGWNCKKGYVSDDYFWSLTDILEKNGKVVYDHEMLSFDRNFTENVTIFAVDEDEELSSFYDMYELTYQINTPPSLTSLRGDDENFVLRPREELTYAFKFLDTIPKTKIDSNYGRL